MAERKAPLILIVLGFLAITGIPLVFFIFGWHSVDVGCERSMQAVTCQLEESFAAGLYVRKAVATGVNGIDYATRANRNSSGSTTVLTSKLVFETTNGEVDITTVSSNTADKAKGELIQSFRAWQDSATNQPFAHHAGMVDIFGWLGALGVAFWAWVLLSWPYYLYKKRKANPQ